MNINLSNKLKIIIYEKKDEERVDMSDVLKELFDLSDWIYQEGLKRGYGR